MNINPQELFANTRREVNLMVKFHHLRYHDMSGRPTSRGGCTVAYIQPQPGIILYAEAHCHPKDNFSRKQGRAKASGRLNSDRFIMQYNM